MLYKKTLDLIFLHFRTLFAIINDTHTHKHIDFHTNYLCVSRFNQFIAHASTIHARYAHYMKYCVAVCESHHSDAVIIFSWSSLSITYRKEWCFHPSQWRISAAKKSLQPIAGQTQRLKIRKQYVRSALRPRDRRSLQCTSRAVGLAAMPSVGRRYIEFYH